MKPHIFKMEGEWWVTPGPRSVIVERMGTFRAARRKAKDYWRVAQWNAGVGR